MVKLIPMSPQNGADTMKISVLGIDLGKNAFHIHGVNAQGQRRVQKKWSASKLRECMARLEPCLVGLEACGGAHYWARTLQGYGHAVRLMSPQFVKPYVKSNKHDVLDAEAICEAVTRPTMRFVPIKSVEQQDLQSLHRARSLVVAQRTAQVNQIRGFLLEYGIVIPQGIQVLRRQLPLILAEPDNGLTAAMRPLLQHLEAQLIQLDQGVGHFEAHIKQAAKENELCQRLLSMPGLGPLSATALMAAVGAAHQFKNAREMAAWVGLVPRQYSTGGKVRLLGISKRGDPYVRTLLIHGARAVLRTAATKQDNRSRWLLRLQGRRGKPVATVALANKTVRTAWALLRQGTFYNSTLTA
jgi:transposase